MSERISDMPSVDSLSGDELVPVVQDGVNKKAAASQFGGGGSGTIGGSSGLRDNAAIRANGTGGSTIQSSEVIITDDNGLDLGVNLISGGVERTIEAKGNNSTIAITLKGKGGGSINLLPTGSDGIRVSPSLNLLCAGAVDDGQQNLIISETTQEPNGAGASQVTLYAKTSSVGASNTTLGIRTQQAVESIGTFTASHKLRIWINGVEYWIQLDAV